MTVIKKMSQAMYAAMADVIERAYAEQHEPAPDEYIPVAIAALKSMAEHPSHGMMRAGNDAIFQAQRKDRAWAEEIRAKTGGLPTWEGSDSAACWQAMIDQAIKEGESQN